MAEAAPKRLMAEAACKAEAASHLAEAAEAAEAACSCSCRERIPDVVVVVFLWFFVLCFFRVLVFGLLILILLGFLFGFSLLLWLSLGISRLLLLSTAFGSRFCFGLLFGIYIRRWSCLGLGSLFAPRHCIFRIEEWTCGITHLQLHQIKQVLFQELAVFSSEGYSQVAHPGLQRFESESAVAWR